MSRVGAKKPDLPANEATSSAGTQFWHPTPKPVEQYDNRYSHNPDNLAQLPRQRGRGGRPSFTTALAEILAGCRRLLAADGFLILTARPYRRRGELVDLPGQLEQLAREAGLELHERLVALLCGLRGTELVPRPSFFQIQQQRSGAIPCMLLIAHEDVLVFTKRKPNATQSKP